MQTKRLKGWTNKKALRVGITMSIFWYSTLGSWAYGRFIPFMPKDEGIIWTWLLGTIANLTILVVVLLVAIVMSSVLEWVNEE